MYFLKKSILAFTFCRYLEFVAMSLCGMPEKGDPSYEKFDSHIVKYSDVSILNL